jgi:hypothetical protein
LITGIFYALVDGAFLGLVFAWIYNIFSANPADATGPDVKREAGINYHPMEPKA